MITVRRDAVRTQGRDFGGVIAIISFRPGGWIQQSAVPRCAMLSVGSTGGIGQ